MVDDQPSADAEGFGVKIRTKGYRTVDLAWILVGVLCALNAWMIWSHEAEAKARGVEIRAGQDRQTQSNYFMACIFSTPEAEKRAEFRNESSWCAKMSKMR